VAITQAEAFEVMREHYRTLAEQLAAKVTAVSSAALADRPYEGALAGLVVYLTGEVLPHAAAEEEIVYRAASGLDGLVGTVSELTAENHRLSAATGRLAGSADATAAAWGAQRVAGLFARHAAKEVDVLLPALFADPGTDLAALVTEMSDRIERSDGARSPYATDPLFAVLSLLLDAVMLLAGVGQAEPGRRLAASARAVLREARPELAEYVAAVLRGLVFREGDAPEPTRAPHGS
jgi:hypothetical protein